MTLSSSLFAGEDERERGFRDTLAERFHLSVVRISEGFGVDRTTELLVRDALEREPDIRAVYSAGGGNRAILKAFTEARRECMVFAAHDLDQDNIGLLAAGDHFRHSPRSAP